jgi:hypothetical protein
VSSPSCWPGLTAATYSHPSDLGSFNDRVRPFVGGAAHELQCEECDQLGLGAAARAGRSARDSRPPPRRSVFAVGLTGALGTRRRAPTSSLAARKESSPGLPYWGEQARADGTNFSAAADCRAGESLRGQRRPYGQALCLRSRKQILEGSALIAPPAVVTARMDMR